MDCHCLPVVGEDVFQSGRALRQQHLDCRTHRGKLALSSLCLLPPFLGSTKEVLQGLPLPSIRPYPYCCWCCCSCCCTGPFGQLASTSFTRAKLISLLLRGLRRLPGPLRFLLCIVHLPLQLQDLPLCRHSTLLPQGLCVLLLQSICYLAEGVRGGGASLGPW